MSQLENFVKYLEVERSASVHTVSAYRRDVAEFCANVMENPYFDD